MKKLSGETPAPRPTAGGLAQPPRRKSSVTLGGGSEGPEEEAY
jgi:hypothetical protein